MKGVQSLPEKSIVTDFQNRFVIRLVFPIIHTSIYQINVSNYFFRLSLIDRSFNVLVKELSGKNIEISAQRLYQDIDPSESYAKARNDQLVIMLRKSML